MPVSTVTVSQYEVSPPLEIGATDTLEVRGWYNRDFIAGDGVTVINGSPTNGASGFFYSTTPTINGSGMLTVPAHDIEPTTLSNPTANYFEDLWVNDAFYCHLMPNTQGATGWQIPTVYGDPISFDEIATYNRARRLVYPPNTYFTADEVIREIERIAGSQAYAGFEILGRTELDEAPASASQPIAIGVNSRRAPAFYNVIAPSIGATGNGVTNDQPALNTLVNTTMQLAGSGGEVYFPPGDFFIGTDMTFPANIGLTFDPRARLKLDNGITVTILGGIDAGAWQIFSNATGAGGTITFTGSTATDAIFPEWWGAVADSSTDSAAAIQAAQTALTTLGGGTGGGTLEFGVGTYLVSTAITLLQVKGITWRGAGRFNCELKSTGTDPVVQGNGVWYSRFIGIRFGQTSATTNKGVFELDGNYDGSHTQGVQANSFYDCLFGAHASSTYAFTLNRQGGSVAQGDHCEFFNCHFSGSTEAVFFQNGFNVLNTNFFGGDFQHYTKHGISASNGSIGVYGTTFESAEAYTQVANGGYDIKVGGGVYEAIPIIGCRTESLNFFDGSTGSQVAVIKGFDWTPAAAYTWIALDTLALNVVTFQIAVNGTINMYRVTTPGQTGAAPPTWPNSGTVVDGGVTWTLTALTVVKLGNNAGVLEESTGTASGLFFDKSGIPGSLLSIIRAPEYVKDISSSYTASSNDETFFISAAGGAVVITLPQMPIGKTFTFKRVDTTANPVTLRTAYGNGWENSGNADLVMLSGTTSSLVARFSDSAGSSNDWWVVSKSFQLDTPGAALTISSNTIAPTNTVHQCGAGLLKTITIPSGFVSGNIITLIPTAAFTYDDTGNIGVAAGTAVIGRAMTFTLLNTTWFPSY